MSIVSDILSSPWLLIFRGIWMVVAEILLIRDLRRNNAHLGGFMKVAWIPTVLYSGLLGLAVYAYSGRKEIPHDSLRRRACRSVAHCCSGCGAGEVVGILLAVGLLALGSGWVVAIPFGFAYLFGVALLRTGRPSLRTVATLR